ncbi:uncharacterized protein ACRADG_007825 [Cochliomyia hominivorax]
MHFITKFVCLIFLIFMIMKTTLCSEFSAEEGDPSLSVEDASLEDALRNPQIANDMLKHKNPIITNNELKELWEKLPDYELTDIKK